MTYAIIFSFISVVTTLTGGLVVLHKKEWTEKHLWRFLAFGSGVLLGMTFLHLLPEAWELNARWTSCSVLAAFVLFFIIEHFTVIHPCGEVMGKCHVHSLGYGALLSLALHSFADGLVISFSFLSSFHLGVVVSGAIIVHKFSDGLTLSSLFVGSGYSHRRVWVLNVMLSLATPLGVLLGFWLKPCLSPDILAVLLGMAGGGFLYISTADILPRIHKSHDAWCWVFLLMGIGISSLFPHH